MTSYYITFQFAPFVYTGIGKADQIKAPMILLSSTAQKQCWTMPGRELGGKDYQKDSIRMKETTLE